eukprot:1160777-Pelagomonas_calceolata.AAC.9
MRKEHVLVSGNQGYNALQQVCRRGICKEIKPCFIEFGSIAPVHQHCTQSCLLPTPNLDILVSNESIKVAVKKRPLLLSLLMHRGREIKDNQDLPAAGVKEGDRVVVVRRALCADGESCLVPTPKITRLFFLTSIWHH